MASICIKLNVSSAAFVYLGFYVAFNTVQVISRRVVGRAEETSTYSSLGFCTVNCRPTASNYQLSHLRPWRGSNPGRRGGRQECYHSATVAPDFSSKIPEIIQMCTCELKIASQQSVSPDRTRCNQTYRKFSYSEKCEIWSSDGQDWSYTGRPMP